MKLLRTVKSALNKLFIFELEDGYLIESVHYRGDTLCISTQVGCHVRCTFCASGSHGLIRNLKVHEIVGQYGIVKEELPVKRIAVAGIGEPLANWRNVKEAFWHFKSQGLKVSFYTTGFPLKNLDELLDLPHSGVTVSIHSLDPLKRKVLLPHSGDMDSLLKFLEEKLSRLTKRKRNKISLAYLLLKGVNDSKEDLKRLAGVALRLGVGVTLLNYNDTGRFMPVSPEEYENTFLFLRSLGIRVTLSTRFRRDKIGGCGTLTIGRTADIKREEVRV